MPLRGKMRQDSFGIGGDSSGMHLHRMNCCFVISSETKCFGSDFAREFEMEPEEADNLEHMVLQMQWIAIAYSCLAAF